jgi:Amt family ammonium transporter
MRIDDALDVFAIHGVSGLAGSVLVGVFAFKALGGTVEIAAQTSLIPAIANQVLIQCMGTLVVVFISGLATFIALWVADSVTNLRLDDEQEMAGLDAVDHAETAYNFLNE